jgi:precorrin isomerase
VVTWPAATPDGVHPIEAESYRILRSRIDLSRLPRFSRDVTERVIHASADFDYATDLVCDEEALAAAVDALAGGAAVVADVVMVAAGITGCPVVCKIREPLTQRLARTANITRSARWVLAPSGWWAARRQRCGRSWPGASSPRLSSACRSGSSARPSRRTRFGPAGCGH